MRYLVLTDIHANLEALEQCLVDAQPRRYDQTLVLGDLVGYGGDPNAVVERVQSLEPIAIVRGVMVKDQAGALRRQPAGDGVPDAGAPADAGDQRDPAAQRQRVPAELIGSRFGGSHDG